MNQNSSAKIIVAGSFLVLIFGAVIFLSNNGMKKNSTGEKAMVRAEILAKKLIEKKFLEETQVLATSGANRSLASARMEAAFVQKLEGEVGRDPWGFPFRYKVYKKGEDAKVVVWSNGEDSKQVKAPNEIDQAAENQTLTADNNALIVVVPFDKSIL